MVDIHREQEADIQETIYATLKETTEGKKTPCRQKLHLQRNDNDLHKTTRSEASNNT